MGRSGQGPSKARASDGGTLGGLIGCRICVGESNRGHAHIAAGKMDV